MEKRHIWMLKHVRTMKTSRLPYENPDLRSFEFRYQGALCQSRRMMKFGPEDTPGNIDDEDIVDGGSF